jgi:DNA polymerase-4
MPERIIIHVDMDAFYASVEQHDRVALRDVPVIVGGTGRRGVVAAASYEARTHGVHSAMPMSRARRLCPQCVVVPPRMQRYREVSQRVFAIFHRITPRVEGLSLDEAFLDVSDCQRLFGSAEAIAQRVKEQIRTETGLTASVGIAPNKFLAKLASDMRKPDGLFRITAGERRAVLDPLPITALWGIGTKSAQRLTAAGLHSVRDLRLAPDALLRSLLGRQAEHYRRLAAGEDDRPVVSNAPERSISSEETFEHDLNDGRALERKLLAHSENVGNRLRAKGLKAGTLTLKIRTRDFKTHTRSHSFDPPSDESRVLYNHGRVLLRCWLDEQPGAAVRLLGFGASNFDHGAQPGLFDVQDRARDTRLDAVVDAIRDQFGSTALTRGALLDAPEHRVGKDKPNS